MNSNKAYIDMLCAIFHSQWIFVSNIDDFLIMCANDDYRKANRE